jgi:hypothetical protein
MARLIMWQLGIGDSIFRTNEPEVSKVIRWRTRRRIIYEPQSRGDCITTSTIIEDLDRWIAEEEVLWLTHNNGGGV